jgi:hypothetical protein
MDFVTRQFIVLVKRLRDDVRKLLSSVGRDLHEIKNAIQSVDKNTQAYQQREQPKPEVVAIPHEPEAKQAERHAANCGTKRRDRVRLVVEWLTFFAVAFYGFIAYRQLREMIDATGAAQQSIVESRRSRLQAEKSFGATIEQFHLDQRAWVGPVAVRGITVKENAEAAISITIKNTGKTPALHMQSDLMLYDYLVDKTKRPQFLYTKSGNPIRSIDTMLPQMEGTLAGTTFGIPLSHAQVIAFTSGTDVLYAYGKIKYFDVFKVQHHTTFCFYVTKSLTGANTCDTYNEAD